MKFKIIIIIAFTLLFVSIANEGDAAVMCTDYKSARTGGTGRFAGTAKHTYATTILERYQGIYGSRGLEVNKYFNGPFGRGFLDVHDVTNGVIFDFKFGKPFMKTSQFNKYSNTFGQPINIVDRFGNIIRR